MLGGEVIIITSNNQAMFKGSRGECLNRDPLILLFISVYLFVFLLGNCTLYVDMGLTYLKDNDASSLKSTYTYNTTLPRPT